MIELLTDFNMLIDLLSSSLRLAAPIAFAALAGVLAERSGIYNVGLEGMILAGAFSAAAGAWITGSALLGLFFGMFSGAMCGLLLAVFTIRFKVNQLVVGLAINLLLLGVTTFFARLVFGSQAGNALVPGFLSYEIPFLSDIPLIGPVLFSQDPLIYILLVLTIVGFWWLFRTNSGLDLRAVGENPRAADAAGIKVFRYRYLAVMGSGIIASIGGCHLVLSQVYLFSDGMSAGKGFIALAAVILGRWSPVGALLAALFFGFCEATQLRLQFSNPDIPFQVFLILPYLASIIALIGFVGRSRAPASLGIAYDREAR